MGDTDPGPATQSARAADESDADSSPRAGFLTRLFRRDPIESEAAPAPRRDFGAAEAQAATEIMVNLRRIRRMRVEDVSVPRAEIVAISDEASLDEIVAAFRESEMSRLPVYTGTLDQPKGLVHFKDLALRYGFGAEGAAFDLASLMRPLLYVPPSMRIGVLLQKMQAARIHMALVIDEYGGVDGLVTIEDLLEQIVGDIDDEHDDDESALWSRDGADVVLAQARMDLEDFEAEAGVRLADRELAEEVDTLGGLLVRLAGRVPAQGEIVIHPDGHAFEVLDADARKVKRVRVRFARTGVGEATAAAAE
jgi:magnesium and cobalt transporter